MNCAQAEVCLLQLSLSSSSQHTFVLSKQMLHKYPFLKKGKRNRKNNGFFFYEGKTFRNLEVTF